MDVKLRGWNWGGENLHFVPLNLNERYNELNINREVTLYYQQSYQRCMTDTFLLDHFLELCEVFFPLQFTLILSYLMSLHFTFAFVIFNKILVNNLFLDIVIWSTCKWIKLMEKRRIFRMVIKSDNLLNNCNNFFQRRNPSQVLLWQYLKFFSTVTISLLYFNHKAIILTKQWWWWNMKTKNLVSIWVVCHSSRNSNHTLCNCTVVFYDYKLFCEY